jgi:hypothetical protein
MSRTCRLGDGEGRWKAGRCHRIQHCEVLALALQQADRMPRAARRLTILSALSLLALPALFACGGSGLGSPNQAGGAISSGGATTGPTSNGGSAGGGGNAGTDGGSLGPDSADLGAGDLTCNAPSCCVPIRVVPDRVYLSQLNSHGQISMILSVAGGTSSWWDANVEVLLPSGSSVTCDWARSRPSSDSDLVIVWCPAVGLDVMPSCNSTATVQLRLRSSTYRDGSASQSLCAGSYSRQISVPVQMNCDTGCGSPSNGSFCNVFGQTCSYSTSAPGGNGGLVSVSLPCSCRWNDAYSRLAWSCAVP